MWFKFPLIFNKDSIKGIDIYRRVLQFLYGRAYVSDEDGKDKKNYIDFEVEMLEKRPFKVFLKYARKLERTYHRLEYTFD